VKTNIRLAFILVVLLSTAPSYADSFGSGANTFDIEFVTISNPSNPADTTGDPNPAGSVAYEYRMGKFEISEQMIDKANAEGGLGITKDSRGPNKPATSVSWNEAARFVNWLNASQGFHVAYKFPSEPDDPGYNTFQDILLWAPGDAGYNPNNQFRNSLARYVLPSSNEWYKAAYYDATTGVYYDYPTGSNIAPDGIDFVGDAVFDAVISDGAPTTQPNDITDVGVVSPFGTAGQGGNVYEMLETEYDSLNDSVTAARELRGAGWAQDASGLLPTNRGGVSPSQGDDTFGFRVASIPEPSSFVTMIGMTLIGVICSARRSGARQRHSFNKDFLT
jgi:sulfatase modifying factor 1